MKKYENPELVTAKYEVDEELAALSISGPVDENNVLNDTWNGMFGGNN